MKKAFFIGAGVLAALAAFFEFALVGYRMTAVLLLAGAAVLAIFGLLTGKTTKATKTARIALAVLLLIGLGCFLAAEIPVLADCHSDKDTSADHLIICGAGLIGSTPSRSLTDRLQAALTWLNGNPDFDAVGIRIPTRSLPAVRVLARTPPRPRPWSTGSRPGAWTRPGSY